MGEDSDFTRIKVRKLKDNPDVPDDAGGRCRCYASLQSKLDAASVKVQGFLEYYFYRIGVIIGEYPVPTIISSLLLVLALSFGMLFFDKRDDQDVWLPKESELHQKKEWIQENFPARVYQETALIVAENVLKPDILELMEDLNSIVADVKLNDVSWESLCARPGSMISVGAEATGDGKGLSSETKTMDHADRKSKALKIDFSSLFGFEIPSDVQAIYDDYLGHMEKGGPCLTTSILPVFRVARGQRFNSTSATEANILSKITNELRKTSSLSETRNVSLLLSGIDVGPKGEILGATAALMIWLVKAPPGVENSPENRVIRLWERELVNKILSFGRAKTQVKIFVFTHFSFIDAMMQMLDENMPVLFVGFFLILVYVTITLGKFNRLEHRIYVSLIGIGNVGLSILASYGLCSYAGLFFGPIHPILPFLLLGIGVDDMFVIVQAMKTVKGSDKGIPVPEKMGLTLKSAGVSITITSATDVLAFSIGATTVMPSLSSFCLFAAAGIFIVFLLQLTLFVPCLALDEQRLAARGSACVPCRTVANGYKPSQCSQKPILVLFFKNIFAPLIFRTPVKVASIVLALVLVCVNGYGVYNMQHNFDPRKYIALDSYQDHYLKAVHQYFPRDGEPGSFYIGNIEYWQETENLERLYRYVMGNKYIRQEKVDFWHHSFLVWMRKQKLMAPKFEDEFEFQELLREFLLSTPDGLEYIQDILLNGTLLGEFRIIASRLKFKHVRMTRSEEKEAAMEAVFCIEKAVNFTTAPADDIPLLGYAPVYTPWQANVIISGELVRNLGLTMASVFVITLVLIGDIRVSVWVFICVAFILTDIGGSMHFWGLTIEIVTSISLILAVGLAVDYSAHVGHMYVALKGQREERAKETLVRIGPAVFNGAFSTFLAFVLLANTDSYVFSAFFKAFFCVVVYGVFHGLVFLPVVLSLVGPSMSLKKSSSEDDEDGNKTCEVSKELLENCDGSASHEGSAEPLPCCNVSRGRSSLEDGGGGGGSSTGDRGDGGSSNLEFVFYESHV